MEKNDCGNKGGDHSENMNRIYLSFRDCIVVECESEELTFDRLKEEVLDLFRIVKKDATDSDTEPDLNEVA